MAQAALGWLTIPAVIALITFLSYGSQILFYFIEPSPLDRQETITFNILICCIWVTYARACMTNVGWVPHGWIPDEQVDNKTPERKRWCRKCEAPKPPRAHHCKTCSKCVPKMDHHCPWIASCVSYRTFPHFFRFLIYSVVTMSYLAYFLYIRGAVLWKSRHLPSYLGPTVKQLISLFIVSAANLFAFSIIGLLFVRNVWCLCANITTIESWEIDRHELLVRRARKHGGYLDGPDGIRVKITKQEFPYDIGIYQNIKQGMGTSFFLWLWPFAATPSNECGLSFEVNGFEDPGTSWPPPDPDRIPKRKMDYSHDPSFTSSDQDYIQAFRERQRHDLNRIRQSPTSSLRQRPVGASSRDHETDHVLTENIVSFTDRDRDKGVTWRDSEGERLEDFGVDGAVDYFDEDDIPLAELLRRRQAHTKTTSDQ